jgi:hypothetical protein
MFSSAGYTWKLSNYNLVALYGWNTSPSLNGAINPHQYTSPKLWHKLPLWQKLVRRAPSSIHISKAILLDSGCSQHTFFSKEYFTQLKLYGARDRVSNITGVGDTILQPIGVGTVTITCEVDGEETPMCRRDNGILNISRVIMSE